jgi:hypothetical protein
MNRLSRTAGISLDRTHRAVQAAATGSRSEGVNDQPGSPILGSNSEAGEAGALSGSQSLRPDEILRERKQGPTKTPDPQLGGAGKTSGSDFSATPNTRCPWRGNRDENWRDAQAPVEGHRLFKRCATGGTKQNVGGDQGRANSGSMPNRTTAMAESDRTGILRMGIPQLRKPPTSFTKRWTEGMGERIEESWAAVFPDLLPASHVCIAVDERRCVAAHDCSDAGAFIDTDRSSVCAGSGSEPT